MANKQFNVRQIQKHDTEANWDLTDGFIPLDGELIVYDKDATHDKPRIKIGDGVTDVKNLSFSGGGEVASVNGQTGDVVVNEVPTPIYGDRVLQSYYDQATSEYTYDWDELLFNEVPTPSGAGLVLTSYGNGEGAYTYDWDSPLSDSVTSVNGEIGDVTVNVVPDAQYASDGDVLTANGSGGYSWQAPSGGGSGISSAFNVIELTGTHSDINTAAISLFQSFLTAGIAAPGTMITKTASVSAGTLLFAISMHIQEGVFPVIAISLGNNTIGITLTSYTMTGNIFTASGNATIRYYVENVGYFILTFSLLIVGDGLCIIGSVMPEEVVP